jgi:hypothetical protein
VGAGVGLAGRARDTPADAAGEDQMANRITAFLPRLWSNWITLFGSVLTTVAGVTMLLLQLLDLSGGRARTNPYADVLFLLTMPALFVLGLLLIPIGLWFERRRVASAPDGATGPFDVAFRSLLENPITRSRIVFVLLATGANIVLFSLGAQKAVHYMDSQKFCGTTCHTVMQPEWESYGDARHSRVACVQCHIGPGTSWFVRAKINGLKQVWGVATGDYHRPVPSPVEHLRPSRDTCEQCHWPEKFTGNKLRIYPHYKDDQDNTPAFNAMILRVGGRNPQNGKYEGIHWHVSQNAEVRYEVLDDKRLKVGKIQVYDRGQLVSEYLPPKKTRDLPAKAVRTVDCVDCHNRATHIFDERPAFAVDRAMYAGDLDPKTPWLAKIAGDLLRETKVSRDGAPAFFRKALEDRYTKDYADVKPSREVLDRAGGAIAELWLHNNYPAMKVTWGSHKSHVGHRGEGDEVTGCYRCHDDEHEKTLPDGTTKTLGQDCEQCHEPLANEEDPAKFDESLKAMDGIKE